MSTPPSHHMSPEEFRRWGHVMIDWIADYQTHVADYPVLSQVQPGEIRAQLPPHPPAHGEPFDAVLRDVDEIIMPGRDPLAVARLSRVLPIQQQRAEHFWANFCRRDWACRACFGSPAPRAPSWKPTCWIGGGDARPADKIYVKQHRRRRDPGLRVQRVADGHAGGRASARPATSLQRHRHDAGDLQRLSSRPKPTRRWTRRP